MSRRRMMLSKRPPKLAWEWAAYGDELANTSSKAGEKRITLNPWKYSSEKHGDFLKIYSADTETGSCSFRLWDGTSVNLAACMNLEVEIEARWNSLPTITETSKNMFLARIGTHPDGTQNGYNMGISMINASELVSISGTASSNSQAERTLPSNMQRREFWKQKHKIRYVIKDYVLQVYVDNVKTNELAINREPQMTSSYGTALAANFTVQGYGADIDIYSIKARRLGVRHIGKITDIANFMDESLYKLPDKDADGNNICGYFWHMTSSNLCPFWAKDSVTNINRATSLYLYEVDPNKQYKIVRNDTNVLFSAGQICWRFFGEDGKVTETLYGNTSFKCTNPESKYVGFFCINTEGETSYWKQGIPFRVVEA